MKCLLVVAFICAIATASTQTSEPTTPKPIQVSLCEIKAHPERFLKNFVEVKATASHGFEDSMIDNRNCPWPDKGGLWMEYGGTRSTDTMYCCGNSPGQNRKEPLKVNGEVLTLVEDHNFVRFDKLLHAHPKRPSVLVNATLRGRVFARYEGIAGTQMNPGWRGYGHMGCCMLFVVTEVVSVP